MKRRMMLGVCLALVFLLLPDTEHAISMKSYRITPQTEPVDPALRAYSTYNAQTRNHYTLRSYLEKIEAEGGGTLSLVKRRVSVPVTCRGSFQYDHHFRGWCHHQEDEGDRDTKASSNNKYL